MERTNNRLLATSLVFMLVLGFTGGWMSHNALIRLPQIISDTTYVYDTILKEVPRDVIKVRRLEAPVPLPAVADTASIISDYMANYEFLRTFEDSRIRLSITDTITQNRIVGDRVVYQLLQPQTVVINKPVAPERGHLYISHSVDIPLVNIEGYWSNYGGAVNINYTKNYAIYGLGYTLGDIPSLRVQFGIQIF